MTQTPKSSTTKDTSDTNPFVFTDEQKQRFGTQDISTIIGRAWARAYARGILLGGALSKEADTDSVTTQMFNFAQATYIKESNPNCLVQFTDARGLIIQESGL